MADRKCCYLKDGKSDGEPCGADAEWEIYGSKEPREHVDACTQHVGALLDDSEETRVFPLAEDLGEALERAGFIGQIRGKVIVG